MFSLQTFGYFLVVGQLLSVVGLQGVNEWFVISLRCFIVSSVNPCTQKYLRISPYWFFPVGFLLNIGYGGENKNFLQVGTGMATHWSRVKLIKFSPRRRLVAKGRNEARRSASAASTHFIQDCAPTSSSIQQALPTNIHLGADQTLGFDCIPRNTLNQVQGKHGLVCVFEKTGG